MTKWIAIAMTLLVAACGGGGGDSGGGGVVAPQTGQLAITIAGLPAGVAAVVSVTGPSTTTTAPSTVTLSSLVPGRYAVVAGNVVASGSVYAPLIASQDATVTANATASVTVTYAIARIALQEVASGLSTPLFLAAPRNDARLFIVERTGRVRIVKNGVLNATPYLDLSARIATTGEGGLLSIAFDPDYATNGFVYADFVDTSGNIAIERFHVSADPDVADASPLRILSIAHPVNTNHYGGLLAFGADGMLYAGIGDGGGAGDVLGNAQNLAVLLGKLLRVDVRNANPIQPYAIPPDNPFATRNDRRREIWAYGLRNPWRYAFDPTSASLYIADVGQDRREEIDAVGAATAGLNYGWNAVEGTLCSPSDPCDKTGTVVPVLDYPHDATGGCSITGGYVYRGSAIPGIQGRYFYSDFCSGWLRSIAVVDGVATERVDWNIANVGSILSFGQDAQGELYMLSTNGKVYRLVGS